MSLIITQAKPNPLGKDKSKGSDIPTKQLAAEWVDVYNSGNYAQSLSGILVCHLGYPATGGEKMYKLADLTVMGSLSPGEVLRVHSGGQISISELYPVDREGAHKHYSTGKGYAWNNDKVDKPSLYSTTLKRYIDETVYAANPPEGRILKRNGLRQLV